MCRFQTPTIQCSLHDSTSFQLRPLPSLDSFWGPTGTYFAYVFLSFFLFLQHVLYLPSFFISSFHCLCFLALFFSHLSFFLSIFLSFVFYAFRSCIPSFTIFFLPIFVILPFLLPVFLLHVLYLLPSLYFFSLFCYPLPSCVCLCPPPDSFTLETS